jgi:CheY-like chemotaxis protein
MPGESTNIRLLLVDDEEEFRRATSQILKRRGFTIREASSGEEALKEIERERPDIVLLDLKMEGMGGIETLRRIREIDDTLHVIILTGHGDFDSAMSGIKLDIVDFLQKPVDIDQLAVRIRAMLVRGEKAILRESTIRDLMVSPSLYPRVYVDEPVSAMLKALSKAFFQPVPDGIRTGQVRSVLAYDRSENFLGIIRFNDLLKLLLPPFLEQSPYASFFTGMFLAQCKVLGNRSIQELVEDQVSIHASVPLMEAVSLMVRHHLINLPVFEKGALVGILRARDIMLEIERNLGAV